MNLAGVKSGKVASRYRDRGLRVIAVDADGKAYNKSVEKWKDAGADFYLYDKEMNSFEPLYRSLPGFPYNIAIKEWRKRQIYGEDSIKSVFGF